MTAPVTATFVFTDLVDSTATASSLTPEAAEEWRQTHFRLLRGALQATGGAEVKNLGDGLMVVYTSPSRALAGAAGIQQAIEHHNRAGGHPYGVRIGISAGEAAEEDGDFFGDPVVEAARLCAAAGGGQILAADLVRLMVGRHATQTFVEVGPLDLKGLPQPVEAVEVLWEPVEVAGSVPLPGRLVGAATQSVFGFFGRGRELAGLEEARKRARAGRCCEVVLVAGEAGMGKTALVAQSARGAHAEGAIVLFGHADEDLGVAYQPWIEALSTLVRDSDQELVGALPVAQQGALARLLPSIAAPGGAVGDPDTERLLLLEGTVELLAAASREAPLVMVLDDLHWADAASVQVLRHVIASTVSMDLTIMVTYRDTDLTRGDPLSRLLSDLHRDSNVTRLSLAGLEDDELVQLIVAAAGHDLDDREVGFAHALRRETDGNPFFMAEMLRHLFESNALVLGDDGRWTVAGEVEDLGLPTSVRDVVGRRVERLGDPARRVLCVAAVIGRDFDLGVLAEVADTDEDELLDIMDAAVTAAVLVESDTVEQYRFAHALVQHALYEELSAVRRQRVHQRIAETLEARRTTGDAATLAELARHWVAATRPAEPDKAIDYVRQAGDAARDAFAPESAIHWYQQALDLLDRKDAPDARERAEFLIALGIAQHRAAHPTYRDTLLQAADLALQLDATDLVVEATLGLHSLDSMIGDDEARRLAQVALEALGTAESPRRPLVLMTYAQSFDASLEWRDRRRLSLEALDLARQSGDDAVLAQVILESGYDLSTPERRAESIDDLDQAVRIADRLGDPVMRAESRHAAIQARYQALDIQGVDELVRELGGIAAELGLPRERWLHRLSVAGQVLNLGRADEAEEANNQALQAGIEAGTPSALGSFGGYLFEIRLLQGRVDEILQGFVEAARDNPSIAVLRAAITTACCETGRADEARERLAQEGAGGFDFPYNGTWVAGMAHFADTAATVGDQAAAATLLERLAPFDTEVVCPAAFADGALARPLARLATVLGDYDQAERWFTIARDTHARLQMPFWAARGDLDHADLYLARREGNDLERARALVTTAASTASEYGFAGLTKRAAQLLDAT